MSEFKGKTAIVSGAALGMGNLISGKLAEEGANVLLPDIDLAKVEETAEVLHVSPVTVMTSPTFPLVGSTDDMRGDTDWAYVVKLAARRSAAKKENFI